MKSVYLFVLVMKASFRMFVFLNGTNFGGIISRILGEEACTQSVGY